MNKLSALAESDLRSIHGGTGATGDDSLARDIGQYVGGFYGALFGHPILSNLPYVGSLYANLCAFRAATE
jgi:hypothetical protein